MYNDNYQQKLEKDLINIYNTYTQVKLSDIEQFEKEYKEAMVKHGDVLNPLIHYKIEDGKVSIGNSNIISDDRVDHTLQIFEHTLKWCKNNNLHIPDTTIYIWISDRFPWHNEDFEGKIPIFVYAKPLKSKFLIFPDNTFECLNIKKKYKGECYDWNQVKELTEKKCSNISFSNKLKKIYFKGTPTTKRIHKLRENLEEYAKSDSTMDILLDAWQNYQPLYEWCKYKYLLNLPGHYPWSNRLKYLFLMDSLVINVNLKLKNIYPEYEDDVYISLIDYIVEKNVDYIDITEYYYRVNRDSPKEYSDKKDKLNKETFCTVLKKLLQIYEDVDNNPEKYKKMIQSGREKILYLTNNRVYNYIYKAILLNTKINFV